MDDPGCPNYGSNTAHSGSPVQGTASDICCYCKNAVVSTPVPVPVSSLDMEYQYLYQTIHLCLCLKSVQRTISNLLRHASILQGGRTGMVMGVILMKHPPDVCSLTG